MTDHLRIAEMLCTRLCHDLTGPIGAVNNGAEFLSEEGFNLQSQAVELITSSAFSAVTRLQFYRIAYGRVKDHGEAPLAEYQKLAQDFFADGRITLEWPTHYAESAAVTVSLRMVRLLFNLLIAMSGAMIKGGVVRIAIEPVDEIGQSLTLEAKGEGIKWDEETQRLLTTSINVDAVTPKNVQLYLTQQLAEYLQAELSISASPTELVIHAVRKLHEAALIELDSF